MKLLRCGTKLMRVGRKFARATAACRARCGGSCNYWIRYLACPETADTTCRDFPPPERQSIYVRCNTPCPPGCGTAAGDTLPVGIKHRNWCYRRILPQRYGAPEDFPNGLPTGYSPIPDGAERVMVINECHSTACTNSCCSCAVNYYCDRCFNNGPLLCYPAWSIEICFQQGAVAVRLEWPIPDGSLQAWCANITGSSGRYAALPPGAILASTSVCIFNNSRCRCDKIPFTNTYWCRNANDEVCTNPIRMPEGPSFTTLALSPGCASCGKDGGL